MNSRLTPKPNSELTLVWQRWLGKARRFELSLLAMLAISISTTSCGDPAPSEYPSQQVHLEDSTLGPGDIFEVRVYRHEDMTAEYKVSSAGTISFPLIGEVKAGGKTPVEVEKDIQERLADGYLQSPTVSVNLKESKSKNISILGEVNQPVTLDYTEGMTIIDVIARAGGFTPMARKNAVNVTRAQDGKQNRFLIPAEDIGEGSAANFFIRPGDVIFVPRRVW